MDDLKDRIGAVVAALSLIGAIAFGAQRIAYERFYDRFGLAPEDVGLDFTRVVQQTAGGVGIVSFAVTVFVATWVLVSRIRGKEISFTWPLVIGLGLAAFYFLLVLWTNWVDADDAAACAARRDGRPVRGLRTHVPGLLVTKLAVRADRAVLRSADPKNPSAQLWTGRRLVYLGTANGTVFVYDPTPGSERTLRVPSASVLVSVDATTPRYTKQDGCALPPGSKATQL
jgi:hypothetical protein